MGIRVSIEVDFYGHDIKIVREEEYLPEGHAPSETLDMLIASARSSARAALKAKPEPLTFDQADVG